MKIISQLFTQASGSMAGIVASRNRYGQYFRGRVSPVNPGTAPQTGVRLNFADAATRWQSLTPLQRSAWDVWAASVPALGGITGLNAFCACNSLRLQAGLSLLEDAPLVSAMAETDSSISIVADASDNDIDLSFNNALTWATEAGAYLLVYGSRPFPGSRNYFKGGYQYLGKVAGATTPPTSPQTFVSTFDLIVDTYVQVQCRIIRADGRYSSPFRCRANTGA